MSMIELSSRVAQQPVPAVREAKAKEPVSSGVPTASAKERAAVPVYDEYVPEDKSVKQSAGLYRVAHDGDGTPRIQFDRPEGPEEDSPGGRAETCTTNTDQVDREIELLKQRQEELERQLRSAGPQETEALEKRLSAVQNELRQKDNDAYRRQNAQVS